MSQSQFEVGQSCAIGANCQLAHLDTGIGTGPADPADARPVI